MNFKKMNIFTFLMIVSVFAFVLRLVDIASFPGKTSVAEDAPPAKQFEKVDAADKPAEPPSDFLPTTPRHAVPDSADKPATPDAAAATDALPPPPSGADSVPPPMASPYGETSYSASELEVLQSLAKRRDELDKREKQISQQEALLKAAGGEVDRKIAELNKIRSELEDLLNKQKTAEDERVNSLVKIYENMKPKEAARIFDTLEMDVLLSVIGKMSERKTSPILANMDPEKARQVTIQLAEQRKLPDIPADIKKGAAAKAAATPSPAPAATP